MVYFIKCEDYVKVGYTANMKQRHKKYVTENPFPLKVLGVIKGGYTIEKSIHKELLAYKHRGEWFHFTAECHEKIRLIIRNSKNNIEVKEPKRKRRTKKKTISLKAKVVKSKINK